jgi:hypothetical protein
VGDRVAERANEHLPHLLGLPFGELPYSTSTVERCSALPTGRSTGSTTTPATVPQHGSTTRRRRLHGLGRGTPAPTLIVRTDPALGLTDEHVEELLRWAEGL